MDLQNYILATEVIGILSISSSNISMALKEAHEGVDFLKFKGTILLSKSSLYLRKYLRKGINENLDKFTNLDNNILKSELVSNIGLKTVNALIKQKKLTLHKVYAPNKAKNVPKSSRMFEVNECNSEYSFNNKHYSKDINKRINDLEFRMVKKEFVEVNDIKLKSILMDDDKIIFTTTTKDDLIDDEYIEVKKNLFLGWY